MSGEEIRILCVDDEQNVLNALRRLFIDDDYMMLTASSGGDGLSILEGEHVQVVISDYRMPSMNGVEFLREVSTRWPDTVRIVLSGYADTAAIVGAINEGQIYKFIPKPWNDDELKVTVANALERYFLYKKNRELTTELAVKNEELTRLLKTKSDDLDFRSRMLETHQEILDAIPVGVVGIDAKNIMVLCNNTWAEMSGYGCTGMASSVDGTMPAPVLAFIGEVHAGRARSQPMTLNGTEGRLYGNLVKRGETVGGIILAFAPEGGEE